MLKIPIGKKGHNRENFNPKKVAIFIPIYKSYLKGYELISLEFLRKNLKKYDKFLVVPESFDEKTCSFDLSSFVLKRFPDKFFSSIKAYNKLLYKLSFYRQFKDYEYILSYQTDCLVFKDKLDYFCSLGYDYIGAPWIKNSLKKIKNLNKLKVGNGGFSLRKVSSFIKTLERYEKSQHKNYWILRYFLKHSLKDILNYIKRTFLMMGNIPSLFLINEDIFWSEGAKIFNPSFKVAPPKIALAFSFENNVLLCFKLNNNSLPFGAHAFQCKENLENWKKIGVFKNT